VHYTYGSLPVVLIHSFDIICFILINKYEDMMVMMIGLLKQRRNVRVPPATENPSVFEVISRIFPGFN